jgi:hypothetical protein
MVFHRISPRAASRCLWARRTRAERGLAFASLFCGACSLTDYQTNRRRPRTFLSFELHPASTANYLKKVLAATPPPMRVGGLRLRVAAWPPPWETARRTLPVFAVVVGRLPLIRWCLRGWYLCAGDGGPVPAHACAGTALAFVLPRCRPARLLGRPETLPTAFQTVRPALQPRPTALGKHPVPLNP